MILPFALLCSYLMGSIPTAFLLVRSTKDVDIREVGSGNVGATNALRAAGKGIGLAVLLLDGLKGVIVVTLIAGTLLGEATLFSRLLCGLAAVIGHDFPIFLRFRGGKGVATTIGVLLGAMLPIALLGLGVWVVAFLLSRYVSIASMVFGISIPALQASSGRSFVEIFLGAILGILLIARHHGNIRRLIEGSENRFSFGKSKSG